MSDPDASDVGPATRWLLVGFVVAMGLAIGVAAFHYRSKPPETICSNAEARCGEKTDASVQ